MTSASNGRPEPAAGAGVDELQADIERTREELGRTVGALSEKLDVKKHVREGVQERRSDPRTWVVIGGVAAAVVAVVLIRRRSS